MQKKNLINKIGPILVLFVLSPVLAELLSGSTPASRAEQLIFESLFYGPAALLIREYVRRRNLGWFSIILLGIAFGIIEESLLLQSAFNPHFLNFDLSFGRIWGVNWVWSEIIIINHSIWSITIPILLTELIFANRNNKPWLSKLGIGIFTFLYLLSSFGFYTTFYKMSGFSTSWLHYAISGLITAGIIMIASNLKITPLAKYYFKTPRTLVIGIFSFLVSSFWLFLLSLVFRKEPGVPAWLAELSIILLVSVLLSIIIGWINSKWNDLHRFSMACGTIYAGMVFGLIILIQSKNNLDIICQIGFILTVSILMVLLRKNSLNSDFQKGE